MRSSNPVFSRRGFSRDNGYAGFNAQQPQAGSPVRRQPVRATRTRSGQPVRQHPQTAQPAQQLARRRQAPAARRS